MSEYKSHPLVVELLETLGSDVLPTVILDILQNNQKYDKNKSERVINSYVQKLVQNSAHPQALQDKYEELSTKQDGCLVPFVELLSLLSENRELKSYMRSTANVFSESTELKGIDHITTKDVPQIVSTIKAAAIKPKSAKGDLSIPENRLRTQTNKERIHESWDFIKPDAQICTTLLSEIPSCSLENIIIGDLLFVLFGIEGEFIVPEPVIDSTIKRNFRISHSLPPFIKDLVFQILPLASNYSMIQRFIEDKTRMKFEDDVVDRNDICLKTEPLSRMPKYNSQAGQVIQTLCSALSDLLRDYFAVLCQIETEHKNGNMNLVKFMYYVKPVLHTMEVLADIVIAISKSGVEGGRVLSLLHERAANLTGDIQAQKLCVFITQSACQPYMRILEGWIHEGTIYDPAQEFFVDDKEVFGKAEFSFALDYSADYWERRYTIKRERVPRFLDRVADLVLRTGKYLNVIRQCGKSIKAPHHEPLVYSLSETHIEATVNDAYLFASKTLLHMLMNDYDLTGRLLSIKHYFLLDQGDFIVQFMDSCEQELAKNIDDILPMRLESLLELCLRVSGAKDDPYKDDMRTELLPYDLQFQMFKILSIQTNTEKEYWHPPSDKLHLSGLEAFTFACDIKWPISLILNRKSMVCYQMIFRHLFYCKHVERQLCGVWMCNKEAKKFTPRVAVQYRAAFALRQRMLNCIQNLEYYMMVEVIEPSWIAFMQKITKVVNVDEVLQCHNDFLDSTLQNCMITDQMLLKTVTRLCAVCVEFCDFIQEVRPFYIDAELTSMVASMSGSGEMSMSSSGILMKPSVAVMETSLNSSISFSDRIKLFDNKFTAVLIEMLDKINDTKETKTNNIDKLVNVVHRLNYNTFYSEQLEKIQSEKHGDESTF